MKKGLTPTRIISLGFLAAVVTGTLLLMLPCATADGQTSHFIDALFTATSSVCVTGLLTVPAYTQWTLFGQIVILLLIEIGGLGIVTFTTLFMMALGKRIGLEDRILIQNAYNLSNYDGMVNMVRRIFKGTLAVEGVGALLYMTVLVPQYGLKGIWLSVFTSISAFCNAGIDLFGDSSLIPYAGNVVINLVTMALIILGGLGFPVWWYFVDTIKKEHAEGRKYRILKRAPLFVKMALSMTAGLILAGAILVFILEYSNPKTIGNMPLGEKILASLFQSVTWRTAGFATIPQAGLENHTAFLGLLFMFVGGSPSGTAGGIKTTTIMILTATVASMIAEHSDTVVFRRKINGNIVRRALSIFSVSFTVMIISAFLLSITENASEIDVLYEVVSALATVGLSRDLTSGLSLLGKIIIIITMFIGRIGPISLSMFFNSRSYKNKIQYSEENVSVG